MEIQKNLYKGSTIKNIFYKSYLIYIHVHEIAPISKFKYKNVNMLLITYWYTYVCMCVSHVHLSLFSFMQQFVAHSLHGQLHQHIGQKR